MKGIKMICIEDLINTCRAIELLKYSIDITQLDNIKMYWNEKEKKVQERVSPNIVHNCAIKLEEGVADFIQWPVGTYFIRHDQEWYNVFEDSLTDEEKALPVIQVDLETFKGVMKVVKIKGFCSYSDIPVTDYYPEYFEELAKERDTFDFKDVSDCEMVKELTNSKLRSSLIAMLMVSNYPEEVGKAVVNAFDNPLKDFEIEALKDYEVIDNRIYIKIPECDKAIFKSKFNVGDDILRQIKYIVISHNPYDFFFCSYGSNIQSCFSINGTNAGWMGVVPLAAVKGVFMIYGASDKCNKINIIQGKKWNVPHIFFRAWGWLSDKGQLMVDRIYPDGSWRLPDRNDVLEMLSPYLGYDVRTTCKRAQCTPLKYGKEIKEWYNKYRSHTYPDSINLCDKEPVSYHGICYGDRQFVGNDRQMAKSLLNTMHDICEIAEGIEYSNKYQIVNGVLSQARLCPITGLPILATETVSPYAKLFKEKIDGDILVATYCDGWFKADACSSKRISRGKLYYDANEIGVSYKEGSDFWFRDMFSVNNRVPIKVFKETITGSAKTSQFAWVVVRYIEGDRVTFVKYRGKNE